jgi:hypothetical protein
MAEPAASSRLENNLDRPLAPMIYTISTMHCMTVSLAQGGDGLGTAWGEEVALKMLDDAGFSRIETTQVPDDVFNTYFIATLLPATAPHGLLLELPVGHASHIQDMALFLDELMHFTAVARMEPPMP